MIIAAMKQALEALEQAETNCNFVCYEAKNALRAAISEQEKAEPVAWRFTEYPHIVQRNSVNDALAKVYSGSLYWENLYTHPAPVPAGWQLVPVEPTHTQIRSGQLGVTTTCAVAIYKAMLAAAPKPGEKS